MQESALLENKTPQIDSSIEATKQPTVVESRKTLSENAKKAIEKIKHALSGSSPNAEKTLREIAGGEPESERNPLSNKNVIDVEHLPNSTERELSDDSDSDKLEEHVVDENDYEKIELTQAEDQYITDLEQKVNLYRTCVDQLKKVSLYVKDNPQIGGMMAGAALGALSLLSNTPIPPELAGKMSAALGGASIGYGQAETRLGKAAGALGGSAAALGISEGAGHLTDSQTINAAIGFADDAPMIGLGVVAATKAGKRQFNRMREPKAVAS